MVRSNIDLAARGQWFAFILMTFLIGVGGFLLYVGRDASGLATIVTAVCGVVAVFIVGKARRAGDLEMKLGDRP